LALLKTNYPKRYPWHWAVAMPLRLQLAQVYATFANGGFLINPYFIERIESDEVKFFIRPNLKSPALLATVIRNQTLSMRQELLRQELIFL